MMDFFYRYGSCRTSKTATSLATATAASASTKRTKYQNETERKRRLKFNRKYSSSLWWCRPMGLHVCFCLFWCCLPKSDCIYEKFVENAPKMMLIKPTTKVYYDYYCYYGWYFFHSLSIWNLYSMRATAIRRLTNQFTDERTNER